MREGDIINRDTRQFISEPILLNSPETGLVLTNDDIDSEPPQNQMPRKTLLWKVKDHFPSYSIDVTAQTIIIMETGRVLFFKLKPESKLLRKFEERYPGQN